jgi:hypothetical protein
LDDVINIERPTYRDITMESIKKTRKALRKHQNIQETTAKERAKIASDLISSIRMEEKEFSRLLSHPTEVKQHCNSLLGWDQPIRLDNLDPRRKKQLGYKVNHQKLNEPVRVFQHMKIA